VAKRCERFVGTFVRRSSDKTGGFRVSILKDLMRIPFSHKKGLTSRVSSRVSLDLIPNDISSSCDARHSLGSNTGKDGEKQMWKMVWKIP